MKRNSYKASEIEIKKAIERLRSASPDRLLNQWSKISSEWVVGDVARVHREIGMPTIMKMIEEVSRKS